MEEPGGEQAVVEIIRRRTRVEVRNLSYVTYLPTREYLAVIQCLDDATGREIPEDVEFMVKMCFSNARAKRFYRRIFGWWVVAQGDVERPSLELALARTYSKAEFLWTWEQLQPVPVAMWPMSVIRRLWKDGAPKAELRGTLLSFLDGGLYNVIVLREVSKIDDVEIRQWFERKASTHPEMARWIKVDSTTGGRADTVTESALVRS